MSTGALSVLDATKFKIQPILSTDANIDGNY